MIFMDQSDLKRLILCRYINELNKTSRGIKKIDV